MSRLSHLGIGLALCLFALVCFGVSYVAFIGTAVSKPGASVLDRGFIIIYVVFGGLILGGLWLAVLSFRRAFAAPPRSPSHSPATAEPKASVVPNHGTPDEKLAHLVKRPQ